MGKTIDISQLIGDVKRDSSVWMKQLDRLFFWQEGYGAFSIGEPRCRVCQLISKIKKNTTENRIFGVNSEDFWNDIVSNMMNVMFGINCSSLSGTYSCS